MVSSGVTPKNALRAITPLVQADILEEFTGFAPDVVVPRGA